WSEGSARVVRVRLSEIRGCYDLALRNNLHLEGGLTVYFSVARSGRVTAASAYESGLPPEVGSCVSRVFLRMVFPPDDVPPDDGTGHSQILLDFFHDRTRVVRRIMSIHPM
ncbi:MAG: AgmX/PglI C-terminal domain-containing protein, partial [Deltaproteobacteria bacterium]